MKRIIRLAIPILIFFPVSCAQLEDSVQPLSQVPSSDSVRLLEDLPDFETGPSPYDCGPEAAAYALRFFGRERDLNKLTDKLLRPEKKGTSIEVLLAYFKRGNRLKNLDARMLNRNREVLRQAIDHSLMPIVMVDVGRFPKEVFRAGEALYAGQFHFYPVVGYGPDGAVVAEPEGFTHIRWDLFERMWSKAGGRWLLVWDETRDETLEGTRNVRRRYNKAVSLIGQKAYARALEMLGRLVREHPLFARSYGSIGFIRFRQKKYEEAELYYRKALARHPGLMQVQNNLAHLLVRRGKKLEEAEERVNAVINQTSDRWSDRRKAQEEQESTETERTIRTDSNKTLSARLASAYHTRGLLHEKRRAWEKARSDYNASIRFSSSDRTSFQYRVFNRLGRVQKRLGRPVEARRSYLQALRLASNADQRRNVREELNRLNTSVNEHERTGAVPPKDR